jgi:hypothetical protein
MFRSHVAIGSRSLAVWRRATIGRPRYSSLIAIVATATGLSMAMTERGSTGGGLTGDELQRKVAGHTWAWKSEAFGSSGVTTYFRDGRLVMTVDGLHGFERGRWRIDGDRFCITLTGNAESCSDGISQVDDGTLFSESSRTIFTLRDPN